MLTLSFTFPAGRYHATPWERHVNEGAVAWPPEPWRILRALIATWHHKVKHQGVHEEATLLALIESLSSELPEYGLPAASHSHARHYMPQAGIGKTSLVFDAFAAINRSDPLVVVWPSLDLSSEQQSLLDDLLRDMGYLGRAESWVEACRVTTPATTPASTNCKPSNVAVDTDTGELKGEIVTLYASLPKAEYSSLRDSFLIDKKAIKKLGDTLPDNLLDALSVDTASLRKLGWSQPPAVRKVSYLRPVDALRPVYASSKVNKPRVAQVNFILTGKPLPRVEDTLCVAETMRAAVMGKAKYLLGADAIPPLLSGHDLPESNRHQHAFYLPWDSNQDGRLDRVLVHVPAGMGDVEQQVLEALRNVRSREGGEWQLVLESMGAADLDNPLTAQARVWESITPYLHPWHIKKSFDVAAQIRRECRERGLPEPGNIEQISRVEVGKGRKAGVMDFKRFRRHRGIHQPDLYGRFLRLTFDEPLQGPLALGFACHFGLGLFRTAK